MAKFNHILNNFVAGEISPRLYGRTDSESYKSSSKEIKNMQVLPQGGVQRRVGTQYIYDKLHNDHVTSVLVDIGSDSRIIPFSYSETENYLILIGSGTLSKLAIDVYNVEEDSWTFQTVIAGYSTHAQPNIGDTNAYFSDPLGDPKTLRELQYTQKGNLLFITHENTPPILIRRTEKNKLEAGFWYERVKNGLIALDEFTYTIPYESNTDTALTLQLGGSLLLGGAATVTASVATFTPSMVGSYLALKKDDGTGLGYLQIISYSNSTLVQGTVTKDLTTVGTTATNKWAQSAWSHESGWPRTCTFAEGRLIFGGSPTYPDAVWFTQINDVFQWSSDSQLDDGVSLVPEDPGILFPSTRKINEITWINGGNRNVLVGTRGAEYLLTKLNALATDTSTGEAQNKFASQSSHGSEYLQPAVIDEQTVFIQRGSRKIRDMVYDGKIEAYKSIDKTFLAEHITRVSNNTGANLSKITQMAYQELDNKILWVIDNNGRLIYLTIDSESGVNAWAHAELGGSNVSVESICVLPSKNGTSDELYLLVTRTIDGNQKTYLEKIGNDFYRNSLNVDSNLRENQPIFMDCSKVFRTSSHPVIYGEFSTTDEMITESLGGSTITGTLTGTQSFAEQEMTLTSGSYVSYPTLNTGDISDKGTIRFSCTIDNYLADQMLVTIYDSAGTNKNLIEVKYSTATNSIEFTAYDFFAVFAFRLRITLSPLGFTNIGVPLFIEANYDLTGGANSLSVNNVSESNTTTASIFLTAMKVRVGADLAAANINTGMTIKDLEIHNTAISEINRGEVYEFQPKIKYNSTDDNNVFKELDYLEGQTVQVLGDGNYLGDYVVTNGSITVSNTPPSGGWSTIIVGLAYQHVLAPSEIDAGSVAGSAQGEIKRIDKLVIRFNGTASCSYGDSEANQEQIIFRDPTAPMGDPIGLYTGDKVLDFDGDHDRNATVVLTGDDPLPCNITCMIIRGKNNG